MERIRWGNGFFDLVMGIGADRPVTIDSLDIAGRERTTPARQPLVELLVLGQGRVLTNTRYTSTAVGNRLRYLGHRTETGDTAETLVIDQRDEVTGLQFSTALTAYAGVPGFQTTTTVHNTSDSAYLIQQVSSPGPRLRPR